MAFQIKDIVMSGKQLFFTYDAIPGCSSKIRLLTLEPGIAETPVCRTLSCYDLHDLSNERPIYKALSYTWGKLSKDQWIWLDKRRFQVQPHLEVALHALRGLDQPVWLWVDAISIDHSNDRERTHQVQMMGIFYATTERVILWLGLPDVNDELAFDYVDHRRGYFSIREKRAALQSIAHKPSWRRAWIRQEILLAKQVDIRCGSRHADWDHPSFHYRYVFREYDISERSFEDDPISKSIKDQESDKIGIHHNNGRKTVAILLL